MPIVLNGTSGDISGSSLTGIDTGKVLQILQAVKTDTASTASTSFGAISGFSQAITTTGSNKVLVRANIKIGTPGGNCLLLRLARTTSGSTSYISIGDASSNRIQASMGGFKSTQPWQIPADSCEFLDSPSAGTHTYFLEWRVSTGSATSYINRSQRDEDQDHAARTASTITVMEVAA
tara:strand:- start:64 stop:597 length:534 start_codon:yes stop_codon:yes gene_type:complete